MLTDDEKAIIDNWDFPVGNRDFPEDRAHENGNYSCLCFRCGNTFIGHKRRVRCKQCETES